MPSKPRAYIDSCCFIDFVKSEVGKDVPADRASEVWHIKQLLLASANRDIEVCTCILTIAECQHAGNGDIRPEVQALFSRLLTSGKHVTLIEPDVFVAEDAQQLRWKHGIKLSGADALHVAAAMSANCTEFMTTDGERDTAEKKKKIIGQASALRKLGLLVIKPSQTGLLSDEYLQTAIPGIPVAPQRKTSRRRR